MLSEANVWIILFQLRCHALAFQEGAFVLLCVWIYYALRLVFKEAGSGRDGGREKTKTEDKKTNSGQLVQVWSHRGRDLNSGSECASCVLLAISFNFSEPVSSLHEWIYSDFLFGDEGLKSIMQTILPVVPSRCLPNKWKNILFSLIN